MTHQWKRAIASFLVLALIAALCLGCAEETEEEAIITIGEITDLTGPGAPGALPFHYVIEDLARYYNEEGLIPGVRVEIATYNTMRDPARDIPGYQWVRERGAQVVIAVMHTTAEILKPYVEKDKIPLVVPVCTMDIVEPSGWLFCASCPPSYEINTLLKWISEERWDYGKGIPQIGFAGWSEPYSVEQERAMREYCQAHPDEFQWAGGFLAPWGTMTWGGEVEKLKDCDYISGFAYPTGSFIREFRSKGHTATFIGTSGQPVYRGFFVDMCGWEALDGMLTTSANLWWNEVSPKVELAEELLYEYRPGQAEEIIYAGSGYLAGYHSVYALFEVLRKAVEEVGAENFDGEAFYNAAIKFKTAGSMWEGYPEWSFGETERHFVKHVQIYQWNAEVGDLIRVSDWLPLVK